MIECLVIADDFTGALDTGAQFAQQGIETCVACGESYDPTLYDHRAQVVCLDAETRHLPPERAYARVRAIAAQAMAAGVKRLFKKVDSTLRGQIGSELAAVLDAAAAPALAFVPAFPAAGRTTVGGVHLLDGKPIHQSVFGQDPFEPIAVSRIEDIIHAQRPLPVVNVAVGGQPPLAPAGRVEVYDAQTEEDVLQAAQAILSSGRRLMAGCAGLAWALAHLISQGGGAVGAPQAKGGMLCVCGSLNPISDRQIAWAQAHGFIRMEIPPAFMAQGQGLDAFTDRVCRAENMGQRPILVAPRTPPGRTAPEIERQRGLIAGRIGQAIKAWYLRGLDHTLVVTGGDTLHAFLQCLGPQVTLRPLCELQPGVVCSTMACRAGGRPLQVISKAGGFGAQSVYLDIARQVLEEGPAREEGNIQ